MRLCLVAFGFLTSACSGSMSEPPAPPPSARAQVVVLGGGPSPRPCAIGQLNADAQRLALADFIATPEPYFGKQLTLRGYLMIETDLMRLIEPRERKADINLDLSRLRAESAQQVLDCKLKLVDVQGYVTHAPGRGSRLVVFAEAITGARPETSP